MGYTSYSSTAYDSVRSATKNVSTDNLFKNTKARTIDNGMDPKNLVVREARDSAAHPLSLAILFGLDETGSMGDIPVNLCRNKLGKLIETMIAHKVSDPAVLFMGIGDHLSDDFPCQVGQFESGTDELIKWLTAVNLEGNGGGQSKESYLLAWYVAARHTSIDCFEKRGKKGYLFTVGDEMTWDELSSDYLKETFGLSEAQNLTAVQLLVEAQKTYHVFHIHVNSTQYRNSAMVIDHWKGLLNERLIILDEADNVAETVAATIAVMEGVDKKAVIDSLGSAGTSVATALINVNSATGVNPSNSPVIEF